MIYYLTNSISLVYQNVYVYCDTFHKYFLNLMVQIANPESIDMTTFYAMPKTVSNGTPSDTA